MSVTNIAYGSNFNPTNVFVPGVYLQVIPPQAFFGGAPTSIAFTEGTASWGQFNVPTLLSNPQNLAATYGTITAAALTDNSDLPTAITQALQQASQSNPIAIYGTRVKHSPGDSETLTITGTTTTGDVINIRFTNPQLPGGTYNLQYVVGSGDTTVTLLAASIVAAIAINATLGALNIRATNSSGVITVTWPPTIGVVTFAIAVNTVGETATFSGTVTTGETTVLTITNALLVGGSLSVPYTALSTDTTATLYAASFVTKLSAITALTNIGITATSSGAVLTFANTSTALTTYTKTNSAHISIALAGTVTEIFTNAFVGGGPFQATVVLNDTTVAPVAGGTVTAVWCGILGNQIQIINAKNNSNNTITTTVVPFPGGGNVETYSNLPNTTGFFVALAAAFANGIGSQRPPSQFVRIPNPVVTTSPPALGQFALSGGTDGRAGLTSADLVGSPVAPVSGIYTAQNTQFTPSVLWVPGLTDTTVFATIQAFLDQNNIFGLFTFATGQSVPAVVQQKNNIGIQDYQVGYCKDWVYWYDQANAQTRLTDPLSIMGGAITGLGPWESPLNKPVNGVVGTEKNNPFTGNAQYSYGELAELGQAGIMTLVNPILAGPQWGFQNGFNSVGSNLPTAFVEYSRLTNFLAQTNGMYLGLYAGKLQGITAGDAVRAQVRASLNGVLQGLKTSQYIGPYTVQCDLNNNTSQSIGQHVLSIYETVNYLSSIYYIYTQLLGGTTVTTVGQLANN